MLGQDVRGASGVSADHSTVKRLPLVQQRITPADMTGTAPGCHFIDFGKAYFAGLEIEISKPAAGRKVIVRMGETLSGPRTVEQKPKGSVRFHYPEGENIDRSRASGRPDQHCATTVPEGRVRAPRGRGDSYRDHPRHCGLAGRRARREPHAGSEHGGERLPLSGAAQDG